MPADRLIVLDFADIGDYDTLQRSLYKAADRPAFDPDGNVIEREPDLVQTALKKQGVEEASLLLWNWTHPDPELP